jgi:hypothetical protein
VQYPQLPQYAEKPSILGISRSNTTASGVRSCIKSTLPNHEAIRPFCMHITLMEFPVCRLKAHYVDPPPTPRFIPSSRFRGFMRGFLKPIGKVLGNRNHFDADGWLIERGGKEHKMHVAKSTKLDSVKPRRHGEGLCHRPGAYDDVTA